jgi:hypothetical protein
MDTHQPRHQVKVCFTLSKTTDESWVIGLTNP